jgi:hypothetical protein
MGAAMARSGNFRAFSHPKNMPLEGNVLLGLPWYSDRVAFYNPFFIKDLCFVSNISGLWAHMLLK